MNTLNFYTLPFSKNTHGFRIYDAASNPSFRIYDNSMISDILESINNENGLSLNLSIHQYDPMLILNNNKPFIMIIGMTNLISKYNLSEQSAKEIQLNLRDWIIDKLS